LFVAADRSHVETFQNKPHNSAPEYGLHELMARTRMDEGSRVPAASGEFADVTAFLRPRCVAVVGASDRPGNVGGAAVRFFQKFKSPCAVYPVNSRAESVAGLRAYPSMATLPETADLAILAVPAAAVSKAVAACSAAGTKAGIVWAGGFAEGGDEGAARQADLVAICRKTGFLALGPNCLGVIDTRAPMTASFASMMLAVDRLLPGNISMVSQSGGLATIAHALAQQQGYGFRYTISTGNEAVLGVADFLRALVDDAETKVIALYLEGSRDGDKIRRALAAARAARKPVIVLKAGATAASAIAAAAHTGALAGEKRVWDAILRSSAAIQADTLEELLDLALQLSGAELSKLPTNLGVATITFGGGSGVLAADQCDRAGLSVPPLSAGTRAALEGIVPPLASTRNPVDLTPQSYLDSQWLNKFPRVLDVIAADPGIGTVLLQLGPMSRGDVDLAESIAAFRNRCPKPVLAAWPLALDAAREAFRSASMHVYPEYSRGIRAIGRLATYAEDLVAPGEPAALAEFDWAAALAPVGPNEVITEDRCHSLLARAGLPVASGRLAKTETEAVEIAHAVGMPVVMKAISRQVTHRAAAGLVTLSLASEDDVRRAWTSVEGRARAKSVALDGIYVQKMEPEGVELLLSAFRDPDFGVMISMGAGGVMTELIDDVILSPAPLTVAAAERALDRLRIVRRTGGDAAAKKAELARCVAHFSALAASAPWRRFVLELNPVRWSPDKVAIVDGLLIIAEP
jgi:acyl-CoA synthetase (NDP forming)